ncbi:MAG: KilA-N domain-containing protein [Waterburya sp.]
MAILLYKDQSIEQRDVDGYVNATQMCKTVDEDTSDWLKTRDAQLYIEAISQKTGISGNSLVVRVSEGFPAKKSTWIHPKLAICLGRWISVDFAIWCDEHIRTLMETGKTELVKPSVNPALLVAREYSEIKNLVDDNPRLAQLLIDSTVNYHLGTNLLTQTTTTSLKGVVEIAEELGYKTNHSSRVKLGQFVAQLGFQKHPEKRLCNGIMREINCYEDNSELRSAIAKFFS